MSVPDRDRRIHKPTPKRIDDFRKEGQIAISKDLTTVCTLAGGSVALIATASASMESFAEFLSDVIANLRPGHQEGLMLAGARALAVAWIPTIVGCLLGYMVAAALQLGYPPATGQIKLDPSRLVSPQAVLSALSPKEAFGRALKAVAKVAFVGLMGFWALRADLDAFSSTAMLEPKTLLERAISTSTRLLLQAGGALVVLAAIDYAYSRRTLMAKMMMTPEEYKREAREQEGDPAIRRRRRQRMRELARRRVSAVKTADVVLVNPTEFAVALRYRPDKDRAPCVVAKGRRIQAERIREIARKAGVPIVPRPPLARLLYKLVPEGREIPANLYRAVAEVLAYVYRIRRGAA